MLQGLEAFRWGIVIKQNDVLSNASKASLAPFVIAGAGIKGQRLSSIKWLPMQKPLANHVILIRLAEDPGRCLGPSGPRLRGRRT
eukprot:scaffold143856_cov18-Tisochrysis_lutea.AAC.1